MHKNLKLFIKIAFRLLSSIQSSKKYLKSIEELVQHEVSSRRGEGEGRAMVGGNGWRWVKVIKK